MISNADQSAKRAVEINHPDLGEMCEYKCDCCKQYYLVADPAEAYVVCTETSLPLFYCDDCKFHWEDENKSYERQADRNRASDRRYFYA